MDSSTGLSLMKTKGFGSSGGRAGPSRALAGPGEKAAPHRMWCQAPEQPALHAEARLASC